MDSISMADIESWLDSFDKPGAARKAYAVFRSILRRVQVHDGQCEHCIMG